MNHLTDEQLAGWLAGEADPQTRSHVDSCPQCGAEALELRDGISRYAIAMRRKSALAESAHMQGKLAPRKALAPHRLRWAGAGVLALLLASSTGWLVKPHLNPATAQPTASAPAHLEHDAHSQAASQLSDDELLEAVNNDLSSDVPEALSPVSTITVERNEIAATSAAAKASTASQDSLRRKTNVP